MSVNFYCQVVCLTYNRKWFQISFVCELLPFLEYRFISYENTIMIAWAETFQML